MNRNGTTLIEITLVIALVLLLAAIAIPRFGRLAAAAELNLARIDVHRALDATRGVAVRLGQTIKLEASGSLFVASDPAGEVHWQGRHPSKRGAGLSGFDRPLYMARDGLATGVSNRTLILSRGRETRRVVISRLGRIR